MLNLWQSAKVLHEWTEQPMQQGVRYRRFTNSTAEHTVVVLQRERCALRNIPVGQILIKAQTAREESLESAI